MNMTDFYNINWKQLPVFHLHFCLENLHLTQQYTLIKGLSIYLCNLLFLARVLLWAILNLLRFHLFVNNLFVYFQLSFWSHYSTEVRALADL